jgi:hypothetical protein
MHPDSEHVKSVFGAIFWSIRWPESATSRGMKGSLRMTALLKRPNTVPASDILREIDIATATFVKINRERMAAQNRAIRQNRLIETEHEFAKVLMASS